MASPPDLSQRRASLYGDVIDAFTLARSQRSTEWRAIFETFDRAFKEARKDRAASTPRLNILDVFGLKTRELRHSRVLEWFLKEGETHEQGNLFMSALLDLLGARSSNLANYHVQREKPDHVDLAAYKKGEFAVFIENKVEHHEREMQFRDLQDSLIRWSASHNIHESSRFAVFLTDDGRPPATAHAIAPSGFVPANLRPLSRIQLFRAFQDSLRNQAEGSKSVLLTAFLESYVTAITKHRGAIE